MDEAKPTPSEQNKQQSQQMPQVPNGMGTAPNRTTGVAPTPRATMTGTMRAVDPNLPRGVEGRGYSIFTPEEHWPPPIYIHPTATPEELYYIEHRWHAEWSYYDKKASQAKKSFQRVQLTITVGSAAVPVLVGIQALDDRLDFALYLITILISFLVAAASAIETVKKYGDDWRTYRSAAEELGREKALYDVRTGPYRRSKNPFLLFVERCEEVVAKQNGAWSALKEEQATQLDQYAQDEYGNYTGYASATTGENSAVDLG